MVLINIQICLLQIVFRLNYNNLGRLIIICFPFSSWKARKFHVWELQKCMAWNH